MRDTARAPQPPTNPPTGHQMSRQGLAQYDQFLGKIVSTKNPNFYWRKQKFWYPHNGSRFKVGRETKWAKNANNWPKKPIFAKYGRFLAEIPYSCGSK